MRRPLAGAFALAAVVDLVSLAAGWDVGHTVAKPLLMPLLAAYAASRGAPRLLIAALLCGWGGDTLLLFDAEPAFLAGMGCFAAGHICYLALFRAYGEARARSAYLAPAYAVVLVISIALLWPGLPADLRVPVAGYSLLLTAMAYAAATRLGLLAGLGGALFVLSDSLIATGVAEWPQPPRPDLWIMLTYIAAQSLLVTGVLGERRPRESAYGEVRSTTL
ncbi:MULTISPECIES: lysoplasmalogenase [unclassified Streptomyces]|uniref:lysoplasmalogenase n=1 Tax=unclassified Streptomyces TaxID=2593676 RepID=UPI0022509F77|nr:MULTISPECIES: lysoplasmalogenase [unclassified Streptomyces]MCX5335173.1 lysoplasmalogenase [Streptomyces sp. NBC_00140]MCX5364669.1 lysoplasmalogenase [Streptomyces sp. NBC_00124]